MYGVTTGLGGSGEFLDVPLNSLGIDSFGSLADTRTSETSLLGKAILQHQQIGVISKDQTGRLPVLDPFTSTAMPSSWTR